MEEADIRYPTDCGLAAEAVRVLTRAADKGAAIPGLATKMRDRSRAASGRARELGRSLTRRTGDAKEEVQTLTEEIAGLARASPGQARRLLKEAEQATAEPRPRGGTGRRRARGDDPGEQGGGTDAPALQRREDRQPSGLASRPRRPDLYARALPNPTQFGYTTRYAERTPNTRRGARGLLLPPKTAIGSAHENSLLPDTVAELLALDLKPPEAVFDGGFGIRKALATMTPLESRESIAGRPTNEGSRRTRKRLASHRVGCEGRISHLQREYGGRASG